MPTSKPCRYTRCVKRSLSEHAQLISHLSCQALEAVVFLPDAAVFPGKPAHAEKAKDGGFVATAGDKGQVRVWDLSTRSAVAEEHDKSAALTHLLYVQLHFQKIPTLLLPSSFTSYLSPLAAHCQTRRS